MNSVFQGQADTKKSTREEVGEQICCRGLGSRWGACPLCDHYCYIRSTPVCCGDKQHESVCFPTVLLSVELTNRNRGLNREVANVEKSPASCRGHAST